MSVAVATATAGNTRQRTFDLRWSRPVSRLNGSLQRTSGISRTSSSSSGSIVQAPQPISEVIISLRLRARRASRSIATLQGCTTDSAAGSCAALWLFPMIQVESISKLYRIYERPSGRLKEILLRGRRKYHRDFWALKDISLKVGTGEAVGVIGRNGAGKTTLLQIIAGILQPTTGDVRVEGRVTALLELGSGFNPEYTGRENILLSGQILGFTEQEMRRRLDVIVDFAELSGFVDQPVKTYSTGMLMR